MCWHFGIWHMKGHVVCNGSLFRGNREKMDFFKKVVKILLTFGENMILYRSRLTGRSAVW